jgi:5'-nucleotidase
LTFRENIAPIPGPRRIFCNRTLNLRSIQAIGFDMDYTLVHYTSDGGRAAPTSTASSASAREGSSSRPHEFDPELGDARPDPRRRARQHREGQPLRLREARDATEPDDGLRGMRKAYERTVVDLSDKRWVFVNTLFGMSESCMYMQLVDLFDAGRRSSWRP